MDRLTKFLRSFHMLVLALAAPMLLWPSISLAYLSAPLSPIYLVMGPHFASCTSTILTVNNTGGTCSSLLGYVYTAQVPGTAPIYKVNMAAGRGGCTSTILTVNRTGGACSSLIGYVYPSIPAPNTYTVSPKYFIGTVIYAPPGAGASSITYGAGTVTGTTVSTTSSWNNSVSAGISLGNESITFGNNFGGSTTHSVDMLRTSSQSETYRAPSADSLNHDYDVIQIFLGVKVNASVNYLGTVTWGVDFSQIASQGFAENGYNVAVGCLRSNSTIPPSQCTNTLNVLGSAGITSADYPSILGANPFADPAAPQTPDPDRYVLIDAVAYFYQPTITTYTYTENNTTTITNSRTSTYSYSVGASSTLPGGILKLSDTFTWSNSSTASNRTGSSNSSAFTLSNPSYAYIGPTTLFVYMDTIYKTFMFSFQ